MYRYAGMLGLGLEEQGRQMGAIGFIFHTAVPCMYMQYMLYHGGQV